MIPFRSLIMFDNEYMIISAFSYAVVVAGIKPVEPQFLRKVRKPSTHRNRIPSLILSRVSRTARQTPFTSHQATVTDAHALLLSNSAYIPVTIGGGQRRR